MAVSINTEELRQLLALTPSWQNIMLVGKHGIGKSQILEAYFRAKNQKVVSLFLGQMSDPGDLIGIPNKNEKTGKTEFMPPYWFPLDNEPIVLFLDELNRARPEILQTIMDLALNRKLAGRSLPEGSRIISAVNEGDEYQLTDLDPALVSRFNIYHFRPTVEEWLVWAQDKGLDGRVTGFIDNNRDYLDGDMLRTLDSGLEKTPDRRAWERVSALLENIDTLDDTTKKAVAGIVGAKAAARFFESFSERRVLSAKEVLMDFASVQDQASQYRVTELSVLNESIFRYLDRLPDGEFSDIMRQNLSAYVNWLVDKGYREAMAQFCNLMESVRYAHANLLMMQQAPQVYQTVNQFILSL
ncbi:MAG: AAA family ATPase [Bacteroides sp.]|nr:AAA family ATPase [Bacteroides sp.]MCM1085582.1 AAA family ATPase [Bacteroides sp.]